MSTLLLVVGVLVSILLLAMFIIIFASPNSKTKRIAAEQKKLNNRMGEEKVDAAPQSAPSSGKTTSSKKWISIGLGIVAVIVILHGIFSSPPSFVSVGHWSWSNWLTLIILFTIIFALIKINVDLLTKTAATALYWVFGTVLFICFVFSPIAGLVAGEDASGDKAVTTICPDMSADETRSCTIGPEWSQWIRTTPGKIACASPAGQFERKEEGGIVFFRFKTSGGNIVKKYRLFPEGSVCPQTLE